MAPRFLAVIAFGMAVGTAIGLYRVVAIWNARLAFLLGFLMCLPCWLLWSALLEQKQYEVERLEKKRRLSRWAETRRNPPGPDWVPVEQYDPDAPLSPEDLEEIEDICEAATPGPWYPRATDDELCASARYVGLKPAMRDALGFLHDGLQGPSEGHDQELDVVAITLLQNPCLTGVSDCREDENTLLIARARTDVPRLVREVRRLREQRGERRSECPGDD